MSCESNHNTYALGLGLDLLLHLCAKPTASTFISVLGNCKTES